MERVIGVIPARYKSKRFPAKMVASILGKSLIEHSYENALKALDEVFVATDDERIASIIERIGGKVIMTSEDCKSGTERIIEAFQKNSELQKADIIVNLQGDHPCISPNTIKSVVEMLKKEKNSSVSTAVSKIDKERASNPNVVKCVFDNNQNALYFSRSAIPYSGPFYYHVGIYAYRTDFFKKLHTIRPSQLQLSEDLEQLKVLENGFPIKIVEVCEEELGVDIFEDIKKVEKFLCQ